MFNVTLMTERKSKLRKDKGVQESDTIHLIEWDFSVKDNFHSTGPNMTNIIAHEISLMEGIVRGKNQSFVSHLTQTKFDAGIGLLLPHEQLILKSLGIPSIKWSFYMPEPFNTVMHRPPWGEVSMTLPIIF